MCASRAPVVPQSIGRCNAAEQGFAASLVDESNLYKWRIEFFNFERGSPLAKDLAAVPGKKIVLEASFPRYSPPPPSPPASWSGDDGGDHIQKAQTHSLLPLSSLAKEDCTRAQLAKAHAHTLTHPAPSFASLAQLRSFLSARSHRVLLTSECFGLASSSARAT